MKIKGLIATAALLLSGTAYGVQNVEPISEVKSSSFGSGKYSCSATCIATCGTGLDAGTLVGEQPVIGWGTSEVDAYNKAAFGCRGLSLGACHSPGNELVVETVSGYRKVGEVSSKGLVVLRTTAATIENCKSADAKK